MPFTLESPQLPCFVVNYVSLNYSQSCFFQKRFYLSRPKNMTTHLNRPFIYMPNKRDIAISLRRKDHIVKESEATLKQTVRTRVITIIDIHKNEAIRRQHVGHLPESGLSGFVAFKVPEYVPKTRYDIEFIGRIRKLLCSHRPYFSRRQFAAEF